MAVPARQEVAERRYRVCVRSSRRPQKLAQVWEKYLSLFGPEVCIYVTADEMPLYKERFPDTRLWEGAKGPGGQVTKMLNDTPMGTWLVVLDDNNSCIKYLGRVAKQANINDMLRKGMTAGVLAFSASQTSNTFGRKVPEGLTIRQDLLYGAFFAMKVPNGQTGAEWAAKIGTRHGSISDDLERSCRIYHEGGVGCMGVFKEITVTKRDKPGLWKAGKGGIADLYRHPKAFMAAKVRHLDAIAKEFPEVQRLPIELAADQKFQAGWKFNPKLRGR